MTSFVCLGDATQDNFFFIDDASVHCNLNKEDCVLELKYGQKIGAEKIGVTLGGNAANVAAGLSKLALPTKLLTTFGDDERGAWIKRELLKAGVNLDDSVTAPGRESNLSGILVFRGERTILTYHPEAEDLALSIPETDWIYLSSSAGRDSGALFGTVIDHKNQFPGVKAAFNPGTKDLKMGPEQMRGILQVTDVLILNWEEAELLLGYQRSKIPPTPSTSLRTSPLGASKNQKFGNAKDLLTTLSDFGPEIVVVTDGPEGAYAFDGKKYIYSRPADFSVLEPTGAGDAFSSGFLAGLWRNDMEISEAMKWGMVNSGSVITKVGGEAGLLTTREINKYLEKHPGFEPTQI